MKWGKMIFVALSLWIAIMLTMQGSAPTRQDESLPLVADDPPPKITVAKAKVEEAADAEPPAVIAVEKKSEDAADPEAHAAEVTHSPHTAKLGAHFEPRKCFLNRVMFEPTRCSRAASLLDVILPLKNVPMFRVAHVGVVDGFYRIAEYIDVFHKKARRGTELIGNMMKAQKTAWQKPYCGQCCECVSASEKRDRSLPFEATLFFAGTTHDHDRDNVTLSSTALTVSAWKGDEIEVIKKMPTSQHPRLQHGLDILSLDSGASDIGLIRSLVLTKKLEVRRMLQFTSMDLETNYSTLVDELKEVGFECYIFTSKSERRSFRGVRIPPFPIAVQLTDCWRPPFTAFHGEPFQVSCVNKDDEAMRELLRGFARRPHRGGGAGCLAPHRLGHRKDWEAPPEAAEEPAN